MRFTIIMVKNNEDFLLIQLPYDLFNREERKVLRRIVLQGIFSSLIQQCS